jgi:hypothetical protein
VALAAVGLSAVRLRTLPAGMTVEARGAEIPAPVLYHLGADVLAFARGGASDEDAPSMA